MSEIKQGYKQTKVGIIPEDWDVVKLGDIFEIKVGKDLDEKNYSPIKTDEHIYPIYSNTVENRGLYGYSKTKEYQGNSLTVVGRGIGLGTAFSRHHDFGAIGRLLVLQPKYNSNVDFISEYINFKMKIFDESSGIPQLTGASFYTYLAPNPPLKEQEKIAQILTTWDASIVKQDELIKEKEQLKKGLMQKLLSAEVRFDGFSDEWEEVRLGEICDIKKGEQLNKDTLENDGEFPVINGGIEPSGFTDDWNTEANTITISEGGNSCGYVNFLQNKFWSGGHCYTLLNLQIDKIFLYQFLKYNQHNIMKLRVGSGLPNIQKSAIEKFTINKPSFDEQQKIAEVLSLADDEINLLKNELQELNLQKKALMQKLLTGQVRVKV